MPGWAGVCAEFGAARWPWAWKTSKWPRRRQKELTLAKSLDPNDPSSWLYAALLDQQQNRINDGIRDLETSKRLNDNRSLYRSRHLLDEDQAVRGANLSAIYRDAGFIDLSRRE